MSTAQKVGPTPGPWVVLACPAGPVVIASGEPRIDDKAFGIALIPHQEGSNLIPWETKEANARLIAVAPDFLAACQGEPTADVSRLDWLSALLGSLEDGTYGRDAIEDPDAMATTLVEVRRLLDELRMAVAKLEADHHGGLSTPL